MKGSISCSLAFICGILAICTMQCTLLGANAYFASIALVLISGLCLKSGLDSIGASNQNQLLAWQNMEEHIDKQTESLIKELQHSNVHIGELLSNKFDRINVITEKLDKLDIVINKLDSLNSEAEKLNKLDTVADKLNKLDALEEMLEKLDVLSSKFNGLKTEVSKIDEIVAKISSLEEQATNDNAEILSALNKQNKNIENIAEKAISEAANNTAVMSSFRDKVKEYLSSISSQMQILNDIKEAIDECETSIKRQKEAMSDFEDNFADQCDDLSDKLKALTQEFKEQNECNRSQLANLQKRYTQLTKNDMDVLNKLYEELK